VTPMPSQVLRGLSSLLLASFLACSSSEPSSSNAPPPDAVAPTSSLFVVPASLDELADVHFYDHPWPSDLRRDASGAIVYQGFYDPHAVSLIASFVATSKGLLHGFSPTAVTYFRFTGDLDPATLPADPPATTGDGASVQIVDVDPASPDHGKRVLAQILWRPNAGVYYLDHTLAIIPVPGYPLRPSTRYAVVVTKGLHGADGKAVTPSADLEEVLGVRPSTSRTQAAHDLFAPAVAELGTLGIPTDQIADLTVFTTNDPTAELFAVADDVHQSVPAPTASAWVGKEQATAYDVYEGSYGPAPNYQEGKAPYASDGGGFVFEAGKPKLQGTFDMRFSLVVPNATACPVPADGYPIALYAHGTGGDYRSVVDESGSVGALLADKCIASMGVDQLFHGARPGAPPPGQSGLEQILFFNLDNPAAARTNNQQAGIDVVQQARLFTDTHMFVPAATSRTAADIHFDAKKILFVGHSQGGLNGPLFLAADGAARGGVLSGAGSVLSITLLEKTQPAPSIVGLVQSTLGLLGDDAAELSVFHPAISLAQALIDVSDPLHYMRYVIREPRNGGAPKSILQLEGVKASGEGDSYAPPHSIEAGARALGLPRLAPGTRPIPEASWGGLDDVTIAAGGLSGNLAGGRASGVLSQFAPKAGSDGHYVLFEVLGARTQAAGFCKNLVDDPIGRVP
jgi:hypothetical protein